MLVIMARIYKMFVRKANREDPDQTASSEAVWSGSALFVWAFLVLVSNLTLIFRSYIIFYF